MTAKTKQTKKISKPGPSRALMRCAQLIVSLMLVGPFCQVAVATSAAGYFSGCLTSMGAGMMGAAAANASANGNSSSAGFSTTGYAITAAITCVAGMAFVGLGGSAASSATEYKMKIENEELVYELRRLNKERCLLANTCKPGGRAIIVDGPTEIRKQGDKVFETTTSTIEALE